MIKGRYTFSLVSLGMLVLEIGLIILCLYQATVSAGSSGLWVGCVGLFSFLIGIVGFRMAWMDRELLGRLYRFPLVMMVLHSMVLILLTAMYLLGLVR